MVAKGQIRVRGAGEQQANDFIAGSLQYRRSGIAGVAKTLTIKAANCDLIAKHDLAHFVRYRHVKENAADAPGAIRSSSAELLDNHVLCSYRRSGWRSNKEDIAADERGLEGFGDCAIDFVVGLVGA